MRALQNLPPIEGADELIVPMNVTEGGQPSPLTPVLSALPLRLGGPSAGHRAPQLVTRAHSHRATKARASQTQQLDAETVLREFYARQASEVLGELNSKSARQRAKSWWDELRWNRELSADLLDLALRVSAEIGAEALADLGIPDPYDTDSTIEYLQAVMDSRAESINATTKEQIEDALANADDPEADTPRDVFATAENERSVTGAVTLTTAIAGIAMMMAGQQAAPDGTATKSWRVNSRNPRAQHLKMNGETVGINESFSNGAAWPGDSILGPDGTSNCECDIIVRIP